MKFLVAPDKFRGSLTASEAAQAIARGVLRACPGAEVIQVPMADGGEGTLDALTAATSGACHEVEVTGPIGVPVRARYGILGDGRTAIIEMAEASGHKDVPPDRRDPSRTTTFGTGELLRLALDSGVRRIVMGIGGSATNDGGSGFARAIGYRFLDAEGREIEAVGGNLDRVARIDPSPRDPRLDDLEILIACDVDNPLCGPLGASAVFGPQKGADPEMVARLDANLAHFAGIIERDLGISVLERPGGGAAGGLGAGLIAFAKGVLRPGVEIVRELVQLDHRMRGSDLVLTGEGRIDGSSSSGKTAVGVARLARSMGIPVIALAGSLGEGYEAVHDHGIDACFSICPGPISLETALREAASLAEATACEIVRGFLAARRTQPA